MCYCFPEQFIIIIIITIVCLDRSGCLGDMTDDRTEIQVFQACNIFRAYLNPVCTCYKKSFQPMEIDRYVVRLVGSHALFSQGNNEHPRMTPTDVLRNSQSVQLEVLHCWRFRRILR
ncbi:hypothetical protein DPMN_093057 [Dreissena polymorpha]|uniref:Secreted protein n=1 Tax=Dreissena polymorpha TaxID=45954 RepID=A0A9D4R1G2_DREPO|nr:hypothetical protein DPMN_093057 [Dreissena polymorpha]